MKLQPRLRGVGLEFRVDPETQEVTVIQPETDASTTLQTQADSDTRLLVQGQDIRFKDFSFQFRSPDRLVVRLRVKNITDDLNFTQPFFFTLSLTSQNIVAARAPLVTDAQLGGDGVLSPGETSKRFRFVVTFREDEPFTFFVDARSAVESTRASCADPVGIPDEALEEAIRSALSKPEGELSCEDLASLRELNASFRASKISKISNLEGLQFAVNLTELRLFNNIISELAPLEKLTGLTELILDRNDISDVAPLAGLTNLTFLSLDENAIQDLTPLADLSNLQTLSVSGNNVSDIGVLVSNSGLSSGDAVILTNNPLSAQALEDIDVLKERGRERIFQQSGAEARTYNLHQPGLHS